MHTEPQPKHQWLNKLIGEWISECEYSMGPNQSPSKIHGTEVVRSLGGVWIVSEGKSEMPEGDTEKPL
jgi:Protein of unknown function (DUF1579)